MSSSELYKVLGGILALGEFSPTELARFSDVDERTVQRILSSEGAAYVQRREHEGPVSRYSIARSRRNSLLAQLRRLEQSEGTSYELDQPLMSSVPASLFVAEDIVLGRLAGAADDLERSRFIGIARMACEDIRSSVLSSGLELSARVEARKMVIESALYLSEAEMNASRLGMVETEGLNELYSAYSVALTRAADTGDSELVQRLSFRYLSSPLGQLVAQSQFSSVSQLPIQPRPVLLFDVHDPDAPASPEIRDDAVSDFVRSIFDQSNITYTPVPLFQVDADHLGVQRGDAFFVGSGDTHTAQPTSFTSYLNLVQPVCILPVPSGQQYSTEIVNRFNSVCRNQPDRLVVGEKFDAQLNNLTFSQHGRYVPIEGLGSVGFMGAVFNGWPSSRAPGRSPGHTL